MRQQIIIFDDCAQFTKSEIANWAGVVDQLASPSVHVDNKPVGTLWRLRSVAVAALYPLTVIGDDKEPGCGIPTGFISIAVEALSWVTHHLQSDAETLE